MPLKIHKTPRLPFHSDLKKIEVAFLVLHYTAGSLKDSLRIFQAPKAKVSCHLIINVDGQVFDLLDCMDGPCLQAWHTGESHWTEKGQLYEGFNDFSIGIELVNKNGNLFNYTKAQYQSLKEVIDHLKNRYPALRSPTRVVGHEHIAGHRGKVDPGHCFNWPLFFKMNYAGQVAPLRKPVLTKKQREFFKEKAKKSINSMTFNQEMEKMVRLSHTDRKNQAF